jgi:ATP-binding cassette subfamily B multidrug efflux pump
MLSKLLKNKLIPYRHLLVVVVVFQAIQSVAGLYLPTLNADIINKGIARGDTGYIWRMGFVMVLVTFIQVVLSIAAVFYGSRAAMGFGRDTRTALFH